MIKNIVVTFILAASLASSNGASLRFEPCDQMSALKPDPKNCSRFYECAEAGWVGIECSIGLEFNPATKLCDYPENVVCPSDLSFRAVTFEPCEPISSLKPDPKNCSRYYECTEAGWEGNECSIGLEFNPATSLCDYPKNVVCPSDLSVRAVRVEPCEPISSLKPDPKNCSRYYECTEAGWEGNECSIGLEFNPSTSLCDYPKNVVCPSDIIISVVRLEPCEHVDELKPDPKNCSRFYECTLAGWVGNACNPGLVFNPETLYCDYPWNVICPSSISVGDEVREPNCGSANYSELFPDPTNCNGYLQCSPLGLVPFKCPSNLRFNQAISRCDWPWRVKC